MMMTGRAGVSSSVAAPNRPGAKGRFDYRSEVIRRTRCMAGRLGKVHCCRMLLVDGGKDVW